MANAAKGWLRQAQYDEAMKRIAQLEAALTKIYEGGNVYASKVAQDVLYPQSQTPVRVVHSKSEHKRLAALGVESVVRARETFDEHKP